MRVTSRVLLEGTSQSGTKEAEERLQMLKHRSSRELETKQIYSLRFCLPDVMTEVMALIFITMITVPVS